MYFVLNWTLMDGANPGKVRKDILEAVDEVKFENVTELTADSCAANVRNGRGSGDVFLLEDKLRGISPGQFVFILVYVGRGNLILHSGDFHDRVLNEIVDY